MSEENEAPSFKYGKKYMSSGLVLPLWRFVTVELFFYLVGHIICLYLLLFTATDVPFSNLCGDSLRDYIWPFQRAKSGGPFDIFRSCLWLASSQSHKVSSDLILTFLLLFTSNAFFLTLMRHINVVVADEKSKKTDAEVNSVGEGALSTSVNGKGGWRSFGMVSCDELLRNSMICKALVLCIVVPICVFSQPANEVRAYGPVGVLLLIVADICVLGLHGRLESLQKFLNWMQAVFILLLIAFSAEANLFT